MQVNNHTPIIVGVSEVYEPVPRDLNRASSPISLASQAASSALVDVAIASALIDTLVVVRIMADTTPSTPSPHGTSGAQ